MIRTALCAGLLLAASALSAQETISRHLALALRLPSGMAVTRDDPNGFNAEGAGLRLELQPVMDRIVGKDALPDETLALARETGYTAAAKPELLELEGLRGSVLQAERDGSRVLVLAMRHRTGRAWLALIRHDAASADVALALAGSFRSTVE
jgi:hypothetical protein